MGLLAVNWPAWWATLGRLHPAVVHFPIALLMLAGALELWRIIRRRSGASPAAVVCLVFGAISAVLAMTLGLIHAHYTGMSDVSTHQWFGVTTAGVSIITAISIKANRPGRASAVYRTGVILCAILVGATGYYGGELTYGNGYVTELLVPTPSSTAPVTNWTAP